MICSSRTDINGQRHVSGAVQEKRIVNKEKDC